MHLSYTDRDDVECDVVGREDDDVDHGRRHQDVHSHAHGMVWVPDLLGEWEEGRGEVTTREPEDRWQFDLTHESQVWMSSMNPKNRIDPKYGSQDTRTSIKAS